MIPLPAAVCERRPVPARGRDAAVFAFVSEAGPLSANAEAGTDIMIVAIATCTERVVRNLSLDLKTEDLLELAID